MRSSENFCATAKDRRMVMRRFAITVVVVVVATLVCAPCFAQRRSRLPRRDRGPSEACYVLVEKAGYEVTCKVYGTKDEVQQRGVVVGKQNRATRKANKALDAEIRALKNKIISKSAQLAKAKDAGAKAELQEEIAQLKTEVEEKKGEKKPFTRLIGPKRFNKLADANEYIEAVRRAAEKARAKAQAKKG